METINCTPKHERKIRATSKKSSFNFCFRCWWKVNVFWRQHLKHCVKNNTIVFIDSRFSAVERKGGMPLGDVATGKKQCHLQPLCMTQWFPIWGCTKWQMGTHIIEKDLKRWPVHAEKRDKHGIWQASGLSENVPLIKFIGSFWSLYTLHLKYHVNNWMNKITFQL